MKHKHLVQKLIKGVAAVALSGVIVFGIVPARSIADSTSDIQQSISEKQAQIKEAEKEKNAIKANITNVQNLKKELERNKADLSFCSDRIHRHVDPVDKDFPFCGTQRACQKVDCRGLSRSIGSEKTIHAAIPDFQTQMIQSRVVASAIYLCRVVKTDHRLFLLPFHRLHVLLAGGFIARSPIVYALCAGKDGGNVYTIQIPF